MARTPLDALVTRKVLDRISVCHNDALLDLIDTDRIDHNVPLKNVCAKVSIDLAGEIDQICDLLGISKRAFLEAAFIDAVLKARDIMNSEGLAEAMNEIPSLEVVEPD